MKPIDVVTYAVPFFVIMVVLLLRPQGLFGEAIAAKKV